VGVKECKEAIAEHPPWMLLSAIAAVPGVVLTWYWRHMNNTERLIIERFAKATEMLGQKNIAQRLGAIYQLERIAEDSLRDHWTVMETLCAFVRERSPRKSSDYSVEEDFITADIRATITVMGHRKHISQEKENDYWLDLHNTNLSGLRMIGLTFSNAEFTNANFQRSVIHSSDLRNASLMGANFKEASLQRSNFSGGKYDNQTIFPDGFNPEDHAMINVDEQPEAPEPADIAPEQRPRTGTE